jgi:uncharacterized glyoxalase superfamily protein PhnB
MIMKINSFTVSLTVENVSLSSQFLITYFGFVEKMAAEGFASLQHKQSGINVIYLQKGIEVLPEFMRTITCAGTILAFVTTHIEREEERLRRAGVPIALPMKTEEWGEKLFMVQDPNGVIIQMVEWV